MEVKCWKWEEGSVIHKRQVEATRDHLLAA